LEPEITNPPERCFMMGDDRGASEDSRYGGRVPREWISGPALFAY